MKVICLGNYYYFVYFYDRALPVYRSFFLAPNRINKFTDIKK